MAEKIVVLDGATLNPGDLSWAPLHRLGECRIYPRTAPEQVFERARDAGMILTNKVVLDAPLLAALPQLRYVGVLATGYNVVDVAAARQRGVVVTNVPGYSTPSVVQMTLALLLELCNHVGLHAELTRNGRWSAAPDFCFWERPLLELSGLTIGLIGFGAIGQGVAAVARALGMSVLVHTRTPAHAGSAGAQVDFVELDTLLQHSDVISLHCPLTEQTRHLLDARRLALCKPTALLLNTGRGPLIDEVALAEALNRGALAGAGLDVLCAEPPPADHPLLTARNCLITPHIAWASAAARQRLLTEACANIAEFLQGTSRNVVS